LKSLSLVIEEDPTILKDKLILFSIKNRFYDVSISVREAAVEIVGKHVVSDLKLLKKYKAFLLERVLDKGQSVRKKVHSIINEVIEKIVEQWTLSISSRDEYRVLLIDVLASFINRMEDDPKMKENLVLSLKKVWFNKS